MINKNGKYHRRRKSILNTDTVWPKVPATALSVRTFRQSLFELNCHNIFIVNNLKFLEY